ncbi:hypothetical protein MIND_01314900 [Mycena indigotica]|uniref:Uncharacterized protein n=1 Tax=Mycena indigotica TaxID=2126181 RepID=A0A8H6S2P3_9AGAR|nr:uncharacterized protein MIND_01314900 [Mycena indigotica]KAF7290742.1 hypothetical protein MIND_01314900 [Mycena indigotica]
MDSTQAANITSFAPEGETAFDLWIEKSFLDGFALAGVGYGVLLVLTWQTMHSFSNFPRGSRPWGLVGYAVMMFALATIGYGSATKINERSFVQDRNAPGGPSGFEIISFTSPVNMMGVVAYVILSWLADGLVLWRFWLVWGCSYIYTIFPALMLLGSVISSLALIVTSFQLENSFWAARSVQFGTAYWSLSISLNILLTLLIVGRILVLRKRVKGTLGAQHAQQYFSSAAMIIESASLYAVVGLIFIVTYARSSSVQNLVFPILGQVQAIAPMLILSRVAQGRAWSQSTIQATTVLSVNANGGSATNIGLGSLPSRQPGAGVDTVTGAQVSNDKQTESMHSLPYTSQV